MPVVTVLQSPRDVDQRLPVHLHRARLEREGRFLHSNDRVGDVIEPNDRLVLAPNVNGR